MSKKNKKIVLLSTILLSSLIIPFVVPSCSCSKQSEKPTNSDQTPVVPGPVIPEEHPKPSQTIISQQSTSINSFNPIKQEIQDRNINRTINHEEYKTNLMQQYAANGFKYPGWNYNYRGNNNQNGYLTLPNGQQLNLYTLVKAERVPGHDNWTYANPDFIENEIKTGQLKKHPAAATFFEKQINDQEKAVNKFFSVPSAVLGESTTGLYIPAGEVATIQFTEKTLNLMKQRGINNFQIIINDNYWDNWDEYSGDRLESGRISNRYPFVQTYFTVSLNKLDQNRCYKFGSPFGGTVSVKVNSRIQNNSNIFYPTYDNYDFNISGALETLSYVHTLTTKQDWDNQMQRVKDGSMSAPTASIDFSYGTAIFPFTNLTQLAYTDLDKVIYPKEVVDKWTAFLFLSEYHDVRDIDQWATKIDFRFCDDVWKGASGWGGSNRLSINIGSGAAAFLHGAKEWDIRHLWLSFHEINHNFHRNNTLWSNFDHNRTNQTTLINLSLIGDSGRWRNPLNINSLFEWNSGGWNRLQNMFSAIQFVNRNIWNGQKKSQDYEISAMFIQTLGTYGFLDYLRHDAKKGNCYGGFGELVALSDFFKLNFWTIMENYYPIWNNGWPQNYQAATSEQKAEIDRLNRSYKSFDFVGNLYSCGSYIWDQDAQDFRYTNDVQPPYEIPAGMDFTFDFEHNINWVNDNFSWSQLEFSPTTKLGGKLRLDPNNNKKLIYTPNKNKIDQIDEFDIAIIPNNFNGKATNYVSKYAWKIKVRQVANLPYYTIFNQFPPEAKTFRNQVDWMKQNPNNVMTTLVNDWRLGTVLNPNQTTGVRIRFNFIAPKDGQYTFEGLFDDGVLVYMAKDATDLDFLQDPTLLFQQSSWNKDWKQGRQKVTLRAGQMLPFDCYLVNNSGAGNFKMRALINDDPATTFDLMDHIVGINANDLVQNPNDLLTNEKYQYHIRTINFNDFQTSMFGLKASREIEFIPADNNHYTFNLSNGHKLYRKDNDAVEFWNTTTGEFCTLFNQPTNIHSIIFGNRTDTWEKGRPQKIKILNVLDNNQEQLMYEGWFGDEFSDRGRDYTIINLSKLWNNVKKIKFIWWNNEQSYGYNVTCFDCILFSEQKCLTVNKVIPIQNPHILPIGSNWEFKQSEENVNISNVNNTYITTNKKDDYLEFEIISEGFDIIGQKNIENSIFDIYIDDQFYGTVDTSNSTREDNAILFSYTPLNPNKSIKVKIVNKANKPLVIDYLQTYGKFVSI